MKAMSLTLILAVLMIAASSAPVAAPPSRADEVLKSYGFRVEIDGVDAGQFRSVDGISVETEVIEYREGGDNSFVHKRPGRTKYSDITLKRGYMNDPTLIEWYRHVINSVGNTSIRKSISVIILRRDSSEAGRYNYFDCFPVSYSLSPLDSDRPQTELIETIKIACETLEMVR